MLRNLNLPLTSLLLMSLLSACSQGNSSNANSQPVAYAVVTVANPGNESDPATGFGNVESIFQIGKYDVTIGQYAVFLNAVAKTDPYSLFDSRMETDLNSAGITRSGLSGSYSYSVMFNSGYSANRPITYILDQIEDPGFRI